MLSKWNDMNYTSLFTLLWPFMEISAGQDKNDQRASITMDYFLPIAGLKIYLEWGRNDFSPGNPLIYPFHTEGYTLGIKKIFLFTDILTGELLLEASKLEATSDYFIAGASTTFYAHHVITQGHTNHGQWLGAGIGTGGNSQFFAFKLIYPRGYGQIFVQRRNPDLDYYIFMNHTLSQYTFLKAGISGIFFITRSLQFSSSLAVRNEFNVPANNVNHRFNIYCSMLIKYQI
jgi:hypothetical protein